MAAMMNGAGKPYTQSDFVLIRQRIKKRREFLRPEQHVQKRKGTKNLGQAWEKLLVCSEGCIPPQALSLEVVKYSRGFLNGVDLCRHLSGLLRYNTT